MEKCVCTLYQGVASLLPSLSPLPFPIGIVQGPGKTTTYHQIFSQITESFPSELMILFSGCADVQTASQIQNVIRSLTHQRGAGTGSVSV